MNLDETQISDITTIPSVTESVITVSEVTECVTEVTTSEAVGYEQIYNAVQSCNATLTVMLSILIVCIVFKIAYKILDICGINE